jgi:hypothetical protein
MNNWLIKAFIQKFLCYLPKGENWNYILQRYITKNLPINDEKFFNKVSTATDHLNYFTKYGLVNELPKAHFYEFGAGWDLAIPLTYYYMGIEHQTIVDIRPNIHFGLTAVWDMKLRR